MCYAIPARIVEIQGENAVVDYGGVLKKVNVSLIDHPRQSEYILVHAGFAIERIEKESAEVSLKAIRDALNLASKGKSNKR